jgi:hypothetical protein
LGHADGAGFDAILCARGRIWWTGAQWSMAYWNR